MTEQEDVERVGRLQEEFERRLAREEYAEALPVIQELTELVRELDGEDTDSHNICRGNLAGTLLNLGRYAEAAALHQQVIQSWDRKKTGDDDELEANLSYLVTGQSKTSHLWAVQNQPGKRLPIVGPG